jgi:transposase-like protein
MPSAHTIDVAPEGRKELIGFTDGARESAQDWRDCCSVLKRRGLDGRPELAIADGALGFWKAAGEIWPTTRELRCWVHKTANVLAKLPKSQSSDWHAARAYARHDHARRIGRAFGS